MSTIVQGKNKSHEQCSEKLLHGEFSTYSFKARSKVIDCVIFLNRVKSDRINALRKQYDEFLEEDKKRKQRNDYILGRLDKMRLSTTILPLRCKINSVMENHSVVNQNIVDTENPTQINKKDQLIPLNGSTNILNDNILLKEITKKYILIPKLQQVENNNNTHLQITVSPQDSVDWKRKYEILDKLKADEKEEPTYNNNQENDNGKNDNKKVLIGKNKNNKHMQQSQSPFYYDDIPEKDLTTDNLECNLVKKEPIPITKDQIEAKGILDNKNNISNLIDNRDTYNHYDEQTEICNYNNAEINSNTNNLEISNLDSQYQDCNEDKNDVYMQNNPESPNVTADVAKEENRAYTYEVNNTSNTQLESAQDNQPLININNDLNIQDSAAKHHKQLISNEPTTFQVTEEYSNNEMNNETAYPAGFQENAEPSVQYQSHENAEPSIQYEAHENAEPSIQYESHENADPSVHYESQENAEPTIQYESQDNVEPTIQYESQDNAEPTVQYESHENAEPTIQYESQDNVEPTIQYESQDNAEPTVQYESHENAEPAIQYESHIEGSAENPIVNSETEAFDTEQKEMYYTEQGEYNYGTYNQDGVTYNAEYKKNENQEITDQYSYYNNEQPEGYSAEANEHDATYQQYDQTYEQQYETTPQDDQNLQEAIHYDQESYDQTQPEYDENKQGHDTTMYEQQNNESVEQIQQQLDYEQGYVEEKHNENEDISTSKLEQVAAENNS